VAQPLTDAQAAALTRTLSSEYGREIQLNLSVDPSVIGGLRVRVGSDVLDGSLLTQFAKLRRDLAA
jgi:F-type H+-transporting ATPase subunit delta